MQRTVNARRCIHCHSNCRGVEAKSDDEQEASNDATAGHYSDAQVFSFSAADEVDTAREPDAESEGHHDGTGNKARGPEFKYSY